MHHRTASEIYSVAIAIITVIKIVVRKRSLPRWRCNQGLNCNITRWKWARQFWFLFFTFFYINRRKYWFLLNFWLPVSDRFTRFGISWTRFQYFWKIFVCLYDWVWEMFVSLSASVFVCACNTSIVAKVELKDNVMKFYI